MLLHTVPTADHSRGLVHPPQAAQDPGVLLAMTLHVLATQTAFYLSFKMVVHLCWPLCELSTILPMNSFSEPESVFYSFAITNFHFIISFSSPINQSYGPLTNLEPMDEMRFK